MKYQKSLVLAPVFLVLFFAKPLAPKGPDIPDDIAQLLSKHTCSSCHAFATKLVGPSWKEIAARKYTKKHIMELVYSPTPGNWPNYPPMAALKNVPKGDLSKIATWLTKVK
ncbi:MAG: cytochrome C [Bacteroidetes bacterium]|nr:cytochrome C [Bacteroidota bacterium]